MKKHIVILGIIILFIVIGLTGCFESDNKELEKFVGAWKYGTSPNSGSLTFFSNGTGIYKIDYAEWKIENGKLIIFLPKRDETFKFDYEFLDDNQTLILTDDNDQIDDYRKI
jgi:hypothetical protein